MATKGKNAFCIAEKFATMEYDESIDQMFVCVFPVALFASSKGDRLIDTWKQPVAET